MLETAMEESDEWCLFPYYLGETLGFPYVVVIKCGIGKEGFWEAWAAPRTHWSSGCWEIPSV